MRRFLRMGAAVATLCCGGGVLAQTDPVPIDPASWVTQDDYPIEALNANEGGTAAMTIQVDARGAVTGCTITQSSGSAALDATSCRLMRERGRFTPATDAKGQPTASSAHRRINWNAPTEAGTIRMPLTSYALIERMTIDEGGQITECTTRHVGELGYLTVGCLKEGDKYWMQKLLGGRLRNGVLTGVSTLLVEGDRLPPDAPTSDLPPYWTVDRTFVVRPDGSIVGCIQRESSKGTVPCEMMQSYMPLADGRSRKVMSETRWAFQPAK